MEGQVRSKFFKMLIKLVLYVFVKALITCKLCDLYLSKVKFSSVAFLCALLRLSALAKSKNGLVRLSGFLES